MVMACEIWGIFWLINGFGFESIGFNIYAKLIERLFMRRRINRIRRRDCALRSVEGAWSVGIKTEQYV